MKTRLTIILSIISWSLFGQPIETLIQEAIDHHPGMKAMQLEYQAALTKADQVKDFPDPTINLGIGVLPVETRLGSQVLKLGAMQPIPWKGLLQSRLDFMVAQAEILSQRDKLLTKDIAYAIRTAYAELRYLESLRSVHGEKIELLSGLNELSQSAVRSGKGNLSDVLMVERMNSMVHSDLNIIDLRKETPTIIINRWRGQAFDLPINIVDSIALDQNLSGYQDYASDRHPQYEIYDAQIAATQSKVSLTKLESKPQIAVGFDYAMISGRSDVTIDQNGRDVFMPMGSVRIPIHTGRYQAIREEQELIQQQIAQKRQATQELYTAEIAKALSTIKYADSEIQKINGLKEITKETLQLLRSEYATEGRKFEELLRLELELIDYDSVILGYRLKKELATAIILKYKED